MFLIKYSKNPDRFLNGERIKKLSILKGNVWVTFDDDEESVMCDPSIASEFINELQALNQNTVTYITKVGEQKVSF